MKVLKYRTSVTQASCENMQNNPTSFLADILKVKAWCVASNNHWEEAFCGRNWGVVFSFL